MKKQIIENIAEDGVTIQQLIKQSKYLQTTMPVSFSLTEEEITDCITDTVIKVHNKMVENKVDKYDYEEFKNYLYISLKNSFTQKTRTNTRKKMVFESIDDYVDMDYKYIDENFEKQDEINYKIYVLFSKILPKFEPEIQAIMIDLLNGMERQAIYLKYNIGRSQLSYIKKRIKRKINRYAK
jgi:hypothetical protein